MAKNLKNIDNETHGFIKEVAGIVMHNHNLNLLSEMADQKKDDHFYKKDNKINTK